MRIRRRTRGKLANDGGEGDEFGAQFFGAGRLPIFQHFQLHYFVHGEEDQGVYYADQGGPNALIQRQKALLLRDIPHNSIEAEQPESKLLLEIAH